MKNRILKIAFFLPTLNVGGIERVFITYANSLSEFYDVEFVLCKKEGILLKELSSKVNVYNLGNVRLANSFYYLRKYLKQNRLDCIITGGDYPNMVLVLASLHLSHRPKIVISQHNYFNIEIEHLGLWAKFSKIWTRIILPQVFRIVIPQLTSEFINVIKVSPMLSVLSVVELTRTAERLVKVTGEAIPFYVTIAIIYFIVCTILEEFVKLQQRRIRKA